MSPVTRLAIIRGGVFVATVALRKTRLAPALHFPFIGSALANIGLLPAGSGALSRGD